MNTQRKGHMRTVRRWPSASQKETSHQKPTLLAPWSWTSSLQNCEKTNFCCLSYPVCDILLWQTKQTIRTSKSVIMYKLLNFLSLKVYNTRGENSVCRIFVRMRDRFIQFQSRYWQVIMERTVVRQPMDHPLAPYWSLKIFVYKTNWITS